METTLQPYKVIAIDNHDRDHISDRLIQSHMTETNATKLANSLNAEADEFGHWYYRAVPMAHSMYQLKTA